MKIADHQCSRTKTIRTYYSKELSDREHKQQIKNIVYPSLTAAAKPLILVDGYPFPHITLCPECNPSPDDSIIAKSDTEGIKIHTLTCKALSTISFEKMLEAHRSNQ